MSLLARVADGVASQLLQTLNFIGRDRLAALLFMARVQPISHGVLLYFPIYQIVSAINHATSIVKERKCLVSPKRLEKVVFKLERFYSTSDLFHFINDIDICVT